MRRKQQKEITRTPQVLLSNGTIRVCDVEKYYGTDNNVTKAVDRVSFTVQKGDLPASWARPDPARPRF